MTVFAVLGLFNVRFLRIRSCGMIGNGARFRVAAGLAHPAHSVYLSLFTPSACRMRATCAEGSKMLPLEGRMGRSGPTYDLRELQRLIGQGPISSSITNVADEGASELGLSRSDIVEAVLELSSRDFYKSMESERLPGLWQDVYHLEFRGVWLYIKLQLALNGRAFVVQFKRR